MKYFRGSVLVVSGVATIWAIAAAHAPRKKVLETSVTLADGAVLSQEFTVDFQARYALAIRLPISVRSQRDNPLPADAFSASFEVRDGSVVVVTGNNAVEPRAAIVSKDVTTRILTHFQAKPDVRYQLFFRLGGVDPRLKGATAVVQIFLEPPAK